MQATLDPRVLTRERAQFDGDGYFVARGLFTSPEVTRIRAAFMEQAADGPVPGLSDMSRPFDPEDPLARYPRMMNPHRHPDKTVGPLSLRYILDERLHGLLRALLGEEPLAAQSMFYFKPPGARGQDLHQDNFYLRVKPGTCIAAWLAVDAADRDNGGMIVVPGSHRMDIVCPERADSSKFFTTEHVPVPAGLREEPVDLAAGDVLFFGGSLIHGSYSNTSRDRFRRALIFHYVPESCAEVSRGYRPLLSFGGEVATREAAAGGGPCGTVAEARAPH